MSTFPFFWLGLAAARGLSAVALFAWPLCVSLSLCCEHASKH